MIPPFCWAFKTATQIVKEPKKNTRAQRRIACDKAVLSILLGSGGDYKH
jgi:hypothetical protein